MTTRYLIWDDTTKSVIEIGAETKWYRMGQEHLGSYIVDLSCTEESIRYGQLAIDNDFLLWSPNGDRQTYPDCFPPEFRTALLLMGVL